MCARSCPAPGRHELSNSKSVLLGASVTVAPPTTDWTQARRIRERLYRAGPRRAPIFLYF